MVTFHNAKTREAIKVLPAFRKMDTQQQIDFMANIKQPTEYNDHEKAVILTYLREAHLICFGKKHNI